MAFFYLKISRRGTEFTEIFFLYKSPFPYLFSAWDLMAIRPLFSPERIALNKGVDMQSGRLCMAARPLYAPHERMTLTLPALL